jgi:hypothetical protein
MGELPDEKIVQTSRPFFAQFLTGVVIGGHMSLALSIAGLDKSETRQVH